MKTTINNFEKDDFDQNKKYEISYKEIKKELGLTDSDIAELFGMNQNSFANSSAKKRYQKALCSFYSIVRAGKK